MKGGAGASAAARGLARGAATKGVSTELGSGDQGANECRVRVRCTPTEFGKTAR